MRQFLETTRHTYRVLALEFLSTLHVEVTSGPISFYLNRKFYELNLSVFNSVFGFPSSMDLPHRYILKEFNLNVFWYEISRYCQYDTSNSKGTVNRNPCICVAQRLFTCGLFGREDTLNVPHLSKLYFLFSMLEGDQIGPRSFFVNQLCRTITSSTQRIISGEPYYPLLLG